MIGLDDGIEIENREEEKCTGCPLSPGNPLPKAPIKTHL